MSSKLNDLIFLGESECCWSGEWVGDDDPWRDGLAGQGPDGGHCCWSCQGQSWGLWTGRLCRWHQEVAGHEGENISWRYLGEIDQSGEYCCVSILCHYSIFCTCYKVVGKLLDATVKVRKGTFYFVFFLQFKQAGYQHDLSYFNI